jgi:isopenicillin-N epimerase
VERRDFLNSIAVGAGALAFVRCGGAPAAPTDEPVPAGAWEAIKADFALDPARIHMAGFFLASHPRAVREAIDAHRRGLDASPFTYIEENVARFETGTRRAAAQYLGVEADAIALTDSTTMGLGLFYGGLVLREGQEILTTTHDHIVTQISLGLRAQRGGTKVSSIPLYDDPAQADAQQIAERLAKAITPKTRVVAVTWVHSGTGVKLPIAALAEVVARANRGRADADRALLVVDGVHGLGIEDVSLPDLGCDAFIAGCHKWIFGPRGTGLVWAQPHAWAATTPIIPTFDPMWRTEPLDKLPAASWMTPGGFHSFEHRWSLAPAFEMHERIGKPKVAERIHALNRLCKEQLAKLPKVKVRTPLADELSAGIICFEVDGLTPKQVVERLLANDIVASTTPDFYVPPYARLAPSLLTLETDVDRAVAAVAAL